MVECDCSCSCGCGGSGSGNANKINTNWTHLWCVQLGYLELLAVVQAHLRDSAIGPTEQHFHFDWLIGLNALGVIVEIAQICRRANRVAIGHTHNNIVAIDALSLADERDGACHSTSR